MPNKNIFNVWKTCSALATGAALVLQMMTPGFAQTFYDGSASHPNPTPGTTINNGDGQATVFQRSDLPSDTVGDAGDATINNNGGTTIFRDDSTANAATIDNKNSGRTILTFTSNLGNATVTNSQGGTTSLSNQTNASTATISNLSGGLTTFEHTSTAGESVITNSNGGATSFASSSSGGSASILNEGGETLFKDTSTAQVSTITNNAGGTTTFQDSSTAAAATIHNKNNSRTLFTGNSTAGVAFIENTTNGSTTFSGSSSAGNAKINSDNGGSAGIGGVFFKETSNAGTSTINSQNGARTGFSDNSTAAAATINNDRGQVLFSGFSSGGSAIINNKNNGFTEFAEHSTAGNATINFSIGGSAAFLGNSTAGNATMNNNGDGIVGFFGNSTAGDARLVNGGGAGNFDFSGTTGSAGDGRVSAGSIAGGGRFSLGGNQLTVGGNGDSTTVSGVIADGGLQGGTGGSLVKTGGGTLTLIGANTYSGGTELRGGVLSVSADANLGAASGNLLFSGGTLATTASFMMTHNIVLQQSGSLDVAGGTALSLTGTVSGPANLLKTGTGALAYDGNSAGFAGRTDVGSGALIVGSTASHGDAVLGGSFNIASGGTLAGHGTVGSGAGSLVTIASGAILSPGNSVGTLTVNGKLAMAAGSHLMTEIGASGAFDRVVVSGTGDISGSTLNVSMQGIKLGRYAILTTGGGLTGTFGAVQGTAVSAFVGVKDVYDAYNAYLDVLQVRGFTDAALTRNQKSAAAGVQSLSGGSPLYDAVVQLPTDAVARSAFDQVSGEVHASAKTALIEDSRFFRSAAIDRIRAAFDGVAAGSGAVMTYADGKPAPVAATTDRSALWAQGFGSWGRTGSDSNAARLNRSSGGFLMGLDAPAFDSWRLGMMAGYSHTSFDVKDRSSSGSSDNYHLGLYGGTQWGNLAFRTGAAYTWHDISTSRNIVFPGFTDRLKSDYAAGTAQVFGEFAYGVGMGATRLESFADLAFVSLNTDSFTEKGGAAALTDVSTSTYNTFTTLGLRASTSFDLNGASVTARGMLGWRHAFGDITPVAIQRFVAGGDSFSIWGVPIAHDVASIEAGLDYAITRNAIFGISYNAQLGSNVSDQSVRTSFNVKF